MCAILDADVVSAVFTNDPAPGAREFKRWIESGGGRLAVGGRLRRELARHGPFKEWLREALLGGAVRDVPDPLVNEEEGKLAAREEPRSNDQHVLALARLSGARLLYSRDEALREDFRNEKLVANPRGKLYPEGKGAECRRWLLRQPRLCARFSPAP